MRVDAEAVQAYVRAVGGGYWGSRDKIGILRK